MAEIRLNKRERFALYTLRNICNSYLEGQQLTITHGANNAMRECLGIDIEQAMKNKKQIKSEKLAPVRGKENFHLKIGGGSQACGDYIAYLHFPFQLKSQR